MEDANWRACLQACRRVLGKGAWDPSVSESWCAFTTFSSLRHGVHYWACGFPDETELLESETLDGGLWRQAFRYEDLAHLIVPATFYWETRLGGSFRSGYKNQDLASLTGQFEGLQLPYRATELIVEIKLY